MFGCLCACFTTVTVYLRVQTPRQRPRLHYSSTHPSTLPPLAYLEVELSADAVQFAIRYWIYKMKPFSAEYFLVTFHYNIKDAIFKRSATSKREYAYVFTGYINKLRATDNLVYYVIDRQTQLHIASIIICRVIVKKSMLSLHESVCFEVTLAKTSGCTKM